MIASRAVAPVEMQFPKTTMVWGLLLCIFAVAILLSPPSPVRLPKSPEEKKAVAAAVAYLAGGPDNEYYLEQTPGISDRWMSWDVTFPPACSLTGYSGKIVTILRGSFAVSESRREHAICMEPHPGWLAVEAAKLQE